MGIKDCPQVALRPSRRDMFCSSSSIRFRGVPVHSLEDKIVTKIEVKPWRQSVEAIGANVHCGKLPGALILQYLMHPIMPAMHYKLRQIGSRLAM